MDKLLVICGPTAVGKTGLALELANKFNGEVVSADSRQVYKKMNIGTGKGIPRGFKYKNSAIRINNFSIGYYTDGETRIWGYDLVNPEDEFSVARYVEIANSVINDIVKRKKLPILEGGTGLYIKGVVDGIETSGIPRNVKLRAILEEMATDELFEMLAQIDSIKAASMNESDRNNPRRLVRAIEVASSEVVVDKTSESYDLLFIGLTADKKTLNDRIDTGIEKRIRQGYEDELRTLLASGVTWEMQSMSSLGYKQWKGVLAGEKNSSDATSEWKREEKRYAKRQMTWFKKDKRVKWFDISDDGWVSSVEKLVEKWYKVMDAP